MATMLAPAFAAEWMTDMEAAKAKAAAENKLVLADFTGSDWCYYCKLLSEKVLNTPEFADYAKDKFVLMEVDMPREKPLSPEQTAQNQALCEQYHIKGFPTILVITPQGEVLGGFVGGASSLQEVQEPLDTALKNRELLALAKSSTGVARAKAYADIYNSLSPACRALADDYRREAVENDPDDTTGFRSQLAAEQKMRALSREIAQAATPAAAEAIIDKNLPTAPLHNKIQLLFMKSSIMTMQAETEDDIIKAKQVALEAAGLIPDKEESEKLRTAVEQGYAAPAEMLKQVKERRSRH